MTAHAAHRGFDSRPRIKPNAAIQFSALDLDFRFGHKAVDEFVQPNSHAVKAALQRSEAWRFALDPNEFLASKARG